MTAAVLLIRLEILGFWWFLVVDALVMMKLQLKKIFDVENQNILNVWYVSLDDINFSFYYYYHLDI